MGILRLLLALAVVFQHTGSIKGLQPLGGVEAVETFFMISGFYMAMILTEKYRGPGAHKLFWSNRALRIYPPYWVVALGTILLWTTARSHAEGHSPLDVFRHLGGTGAWLVTLSNVFIFGQDAVMFTGGDARGHLYFAPNFSTAHEQVWTFLLVPPAWSLALELTFYLLAPFLVRRRLGVLVAIIAASFALRAYLFFAWNYRGDPWTYRFFPTEIGFFLVGSLAYRLYLRLRTRAISRHALTAWALGFYLLFFAYQFLSAMLIGSVALKPWIFFLFAWLSIPLLFLRFKHSRVDRYIGELSYPLYIVHWIVISGVASLWHRLGLTRGEHVMVLAVSLAAAVILIHGVSNPLEYFRQARVARLRSQPTVVDLEGNVRAV